MNQRTSEKYWVVIPAAGIGSRMDSDRPKQYMSLCNKPVLTHVLDTFSAVLEIEKIVVVCSAKDRWWPALAMQQPNKVMHALGGSERVESVLRGLDALVDVAADDDWVLVHDAARPCVLPKDISALISALSGHPVGGLLGLPVVDTLKHVDQSRRVQHTVPRDGLWRAQTPQMFRYALLKQSIKSALLNERLVTDEASALEYAGHQPKMILGDAGNIKLTYPEDFDIATRFLMAQGR